MIDAFIDQLHGRVSLIATTRFGPFSRAGSILNVVICGLLVIFMVASVVNGSPAAITGVVIGLVLGALFVRISIRALRGDFDHH